MLALAAGLPASAEVPEYTVLPIAELTGGALLTGASDSGHLVGWTTNLSGLVRGFVATAEDGLVLLPLPAGYNSSTALDVNNNGVVVGAIDDSGFPYDGGVPAIWTPDGAGGYECTIPQQFATMPSPLGTLSINGGMAVAINDAGVVIGWSRYFGFQGGPATQFSLTGGPADLRDLGFDGTPRDISETGIIVGERLKLDLGTGSVTDIGLPPPVGTVGFSQVIGYRVNDSGEVVAAAGRATSGNDRYLTYLHNDSDGWFPLNAAQLPTRFVGFYDNNNRGNVSATGSVLFRDENVLVNGYDGLLEPGSVQWDTNLGFISNDRSVSTTATNTVDGSTWLVRLIPQPQGCSPADIAEPFGTLNFFDISAFIALFSASDPIADITGDGQLTFFDVAGYLDVFSAGCP